VWRTYMAPQNNNKPGGFSGGFLAANSPSVSGYTTMQACDAVAHGTCVHQSRPAYFKAHIILKLMI
jgi:ribonuclease I